MPPPSATSIAGKAVPAPAGAAQPVQPPPGPVWHRAAAWPADDQIDRFLEGIEHTCAVADKDFKNASKVGDGTTGALRDADAYHAAVQERMAKRKRELAEKELRAMSIGNRR
jgi:hypothetical protein